MSRNVHSLRRSAWQLWSGGAHQKATAGLTSVRHGCFRPAAGSEAASGSEEEEEASEGRHQITCCPTKRAASGRWRRTA